MLLQQGLVMSRDYYNHMKESWRNKYITFADWTHNPNFQNMWWLYDKWRLGNYGKDKEQGMLEKPQQAVHTYNEQNKNTHFPSSEKCIWVLFWHSEQDFALLLACIIIKATNPFFPCVAKIVDVKWVEAIFFFGGPVPSSPLSEPQWFLLYHCHTTVVLPALYHTLGRTLSNENYLWKQFISACGGSH